MRWRYRPASARARDVELKTTTAVGPVLECPRKARNGDVDPKVRWSRAERKETGLNPLCQLSGVAVLLDGRFVSGLPYNTLRLWNVDSGRPLATVYGDTAFDSVAAVNDHLIIAGDTLGNM